MARSWCTEQKIVDLRWIRLNRMTTTPLYRRFLGTIVCVALLVASTSVALADNARKSTAKKTAPVASSPISSAVSTTMRALGSVRTQQQRPQQRVLVGNDTLRKENRFLFVRAASEVLTVRVELARDEAQVEIGVYNMLGKKIMDVHRGATGRGIHEYTTAIQDLPEGVYVCVMQGADFRKAEKFYLSR